MKRLTPYLCLVSLMLVAPLVSAEAGTNIRQQWHDDIRAGYQELADRSRALADQAESYCQAAAPDALEQTRQAWRDAFLAWQQVRFVDFGPVEQGNRAWQFQFWPDPKNLVAKKATYLLKSDEAITAETINQSGVAVQGFPMAEYVLYDQPLAQGKRALPADRSCQLLVAVTRHIARNGKNLTEDWENFAGAYTENEQYTDTTVRAAMAELELVEERRLAGPMGLRGNPKRSVYGADAWRSGSSLVAVDASIHGLKQYFLPAFATLLENREHPDLAERIEQQFEEVLANFPELDRPMAPLLADDSEFRALQSLYVDVTQLRALVNDRAAVALGVVRGFNSSDGD